MRRGEVFSHYRDVVAKEQDFVQRDWQRLETEYGRGMPAAFYSLKTMTRRSGPSIATDFLEPRPSHRLFSIAYEQIPPRAVPRQSRYLKFISRVVLPMGELTQPSAALVLAQLKEERGVDCVKAEGYFRDVLTQIHTGRNAGQEFVNVIHDQKGRPLILQKAVEGRTGLTLVPMTFTKPVEQDGIDVLSMQVPAGTIVDVSTGGSVWDVRRSGNDTFDYETTLIDTPTIRPARLSPWAYDDPLDRLAFALKIEHQTGEPIGYDRERAAMLEHRSLADFQAAAVRVMDLCGVTSNA